MTRKISKTSENSTTSSIPKNSQTGISNSYRAGSIGAMTVAFAFNTLTQGATANSLDAYGNVSNATTAWTRCRDDYRCAASIGLALLMVSAVLLLGPLYSICQKIKRARQENLTAPDDLPLEELIAPPSHGSADNLSILGDSKPLLSTAHPYQAVLQAPPSPDLSDKISNPDIRDSYLDLDEIGEPEEATTESLLRWVNKP